MFHQELCLYHGTNHKANKEDKTLNLDHKVSKNMGSYQAKIHGSTHFKYPQISSWSFMCTNMHHYW